MKQQIDSIFYGVRFDKSMNKYDILNKLDMLYVEAINLINTFDTTNELKKGFIEYAHVLYSNKVLEYVKADEFYNYIETKAQIDFIDNEVNARRDPTNNSYQKMRKL